MLNHFIMHARIFTEWSTRLMLNHFSMHVRFSTEWSTKLMSAMVSGSGQVGPERLYRL